MPGWAPNNDRDGLVSHGSLGCHCFFSQIDIRCHTVGIFPGRSTDRRQDLVSPTREAARPALAGRLRQDCVYSFLPC